MAVWAKIKFFWETMLGSTGSTLTASSTDAGDYSASYLYNMMETNGWKAGVSAGPHYITYDAGAGNVKTADYIAILGHNLGSSGAALSLQFSSDGAAYTDSFTPFMPSSDKALLKEFTSPGNYRYWRVSITGTSVPPYMALCIWGNKTELDYASSDFDPYGQEIKASENLSQGGFLAGIHEQYTERSMSIRFADADALLYGNIKDWWEKSGLKNFFLAWESANNPDDIYLVRPDARFSNPLKSGGLYRDITINLKGRKE